MSQEQIQVPKGWKEESLKNLIELIMGQAPPGDSYNQERVGTTFVKVGEFGEIFPEKKIWTTKPLKFAKTGDVLLCVVGATTGKLNLGIDCAIGRSVSALRPNISKISQKYLYYFLSSQIKKIRSSQQGSAQGIITKTGIFQMKIPLPSLLKQEKIIQKLDDILGQLEEKKKQIFAIIEQNKQRIDFFEKNWFTYIIDREIENHPKRNDWGEKTTKELFYIKGRIGWRGLKKADFTTEGPYLITGVNIINGGIDWKNSYRIPMEKFLESPEIILQKDDILLTKDGTIGKVAYIHDIPGGKASLNAHIHLIRNIENNDVFPLYMFYILHSNRFLSYVKTFQSGATRPSLPQKLFENFTIPLPPLPIQKQIVQNIKNAKEKFQSQKVQFENIKKNYENSITYVNHIQSSILDAAFSGKLVK